MESLAAGSPSSLASSCPLGSLPGAILRRPGVPSRLLRTPPSSRPAAAAGLPSSSENWSRTPTPLTKDYFRRVTFQSAEEGDSSCSGEEDSILPWVSLSRGARSGLAAAAAELREATDPAAILEELPHSVLRQYPAETFVQRPAVLNAVLEHCAYSPDLRARAAAADAAAELCRQFVSRLDYLAENGVGGGGLKGDSIVRWGAEEEDEGDEEILAFHHLRESSISVMELCLVCLGCGALALGAVEGGASGRDGDGGEVLDVVAAAARMVSSVGALGRRVRMRHRVWVASNRDTVPLQEILRDVRTDLHKSLQRHLKTSPSTLTSRACALTTLNSMVSFAEDFLPPDSCLLREAASEVCRDSTLFLTHPSLQRRWLRWAPAEERQAWDEDGILSRTFRDMARAVNFLRGQLVAGKRALEDARAALRLSELHQSPAMVDKVFEMLAEPCQKEEEEAAKCELLLGLLDQDDPSIRSNSFLALHSLVQDSIGVARFVRPLEGIEGGSSAVSFMFRQRRILEVVTETALSGRKHEGQAAKEVLLYFLRASDSVLPSSLCQRIWRGMEAVMPLVECLCGDGGSPLGRAIFESLTIREVRRGSSCGLSDLAALQGNMRLLFSRRVEARRNALANLKMFLAKEPQSHDKLPRFSDIINQDVADVFVNVGKANISVSEESETRQEEEVIQTHPVDELIRTMESLLETAARKADWTKLEVMLLERDTLGKFLEFDGMSFLTEVGARSLREENGPGATKALARWISLAKRVTASCEKARRWAAGSGGFCFVLLRCAFFQWEDPSVRSDLAAMWFAVLYAEFISTKEGKISTSPSLKSSLHVPFDCADEASKLSKAAESSPVDLLPPEYDALLRVFWNVALFDGPKGCLEGEGREGGDRRGRASAYVSLRLSLTGEDLMAIRGSFPSVLSAQARELLQGASDHAEFSRHLCFLGHHLELLSGEDTGDGDGKDSEAGRDVSASHSYWGVSLSVFSRFFSKRPRTSLDRRTVLDVLIYLTRFLNCRQAPLGNRLSWLPDVCKNYSLFVLLLPQSEGQRRISQREVKTVGAFYEKLESAFPGILSSIPQELRPFSEVEPHLLSELLRLRLPVVEKRGRICDDLLPWDVSRLVGQVLPEDLHYSNLARTALQTNVLVLCQAVVGLDESDPLVEELEKNAAVLGEIWTDERRPPIQRTLAMQVTAALAQRERSASATVASIPGIWCRLVTVAFEGSIASPAPLRRAALMTMLNLLSSSGNLHWFGPVAVEVITGLVIAGEGGLGVFYRDNQVFESLQTMFYACGAHDTTVSNRGTTRELQGVSLLSSALQLLSSALEFDVDHCSVRKTLGLAVSKLESMDRESLSEAEETWTEYLSSLLHAGSLAVRRGLFPQDRVAPLLSGLVLLLERTGRRLDSEDRREMASAACSFAAEALAAEARKSEAGTLKGDAAAAAEIVCKYSTRFLAILASEKAWETAAPREEEDENFLLLVKTLSTRARRETLSLGGGKRHYLSERLEKPGIGTEEALGASVANRAMGMLILWPVGEIPLHSLALSALRSLFLVSEVAQVAAMEAGLAEKAERWVRKYLARGGKALATSLELARLGEVLALLANLCYRNSLCKEHLAVGSLPDLLLCSVSHWSHHAFPRGSFLALLETGSAGCQEFATAISRVRPAKEERQQLPYGQSLSLLQFLMERSRLDPDGSSFLSCSRLLLTLSANPEGRRVICRGGLVQALMEKALGGGRSGKPNPRVATPLLDLLLSVTSFPDGQTVMHQCPGVEQFLCDLVTAQRHRSPRLSVAALAVLRNLAMCPAVARRMLRSQPTLDALLAGLSSDREGAGELEVSLQLAWALLAHSTAKGRLSLARDTSAAEVLQSAQLAQRCQAATAAVTAPGRGGCARVLAAVNAIINV